MTLISRFPIDTYFNQYPAKIKVISTVKTEPMVVGSRFYSEYPKIRLEDINKNSSSMFVDVALPNNVRLDSIGGDFDGDTVTVQGIFSKRDPMEYINSPMNIINIAGSTMRAVSDINSQMIFALTKTAEDN